MRFLLLALISIFIFISCSTQKKDNYKKDEIAVSILPQKYFVDRITDSSLNVLVMIPGSESPATYEPKPSQVEALSFVKAYLRIGYIGFELSWMDKFIHANPEIKTFDLSKGINIIEGQCNHEEGDHEHHHHGVDPHIWMSPKNCIIMSSNILDALTTVYPERKQEFTKNYNELKSDILEINSKIDSLLKPYDKRYFLIFHPALTYYAENYQLIQTSIEIEGKEPSLKHMAEIMQLIEAKGINDIFIQQQFDRKNAQTLINETGGEVIEINPLDYNWPQQIMSVSKSMQEVLKQQNAR